MISLTLFNRSRLEVVDADGKARVILAFQELGGRVTVFSKDGKSRASLGIIEHGGSATAVGKVGRLIAVPSVFPFSPLAIASKRACDPLVCRGLQFVRLVYPH